MMDSVLSFWFEELKPAQWWRKSKALDKKIKERFGALYSQAVAGELWQWRDTAKGRLAEIILLDQFSRNLFRDSPQAFAADAMALALAQEAIRAKADQQLTPAERVFLYMPFMHSESKKIHQQASQLFSDNADASQGTKAELKGPISSLKSQQAHSAIIERFGRYPHRNKILARESSKEEIEFLKQPGSSF
ncbi:hypothetical protein CBP12_02465 [Oceanisphaera avium]|uniref:DUF924 domain-containing protein n=2 Tax=Oceanisphaera avium TaxID=1903694 RepID=A0A1Y0CV79_9GAMM|nr:hypothetical protein CBP12_02465 [Oceanisphaera avium]